MSQYPPPYSPPPTHVGPYAGPAYAGPYGPYGPDPLAPGRRAGVLMFVTGGLLLLLGACNAVQSAVLPAAQWEAQMQQQQSAMGQAGSLPVSGETIRAVSLVVGVLMLGVGGTLIGLAVGVRRGGRGATVAALVLTVGLAAVFGLLLLLSVVAGTQVPIAFVMACLFVVPAALAGLQVAWLVAAARGLSGVSAGRDQLAAQYWQYQQQMQAYAGGGYGQGGGYGYAAPPPPPSEPPSSGGAV